MNHTKSRRNAVALLMVYVLSLQLYLNEPKRWAFGFGRTKRISQSLENYIWFSNYRLFGFSVNQLHLVQDALGFLGV